MLLLKHRHPKNKKAIPITEKPIEEPIIIQIEPIVQPIISTPTLVQSTIHIDKEDMDDSMSVISMTDFTIGSTGTIINNKLPSKVSLIYNQDEVVEYFSNILEEDAKPKRKYKPKQKL